MSQGYGQGGYPPQGGQQYPPQGGQQYPPQGGQQYPSQGGPQGYPQQGGQSYPPQQGGPQGFPQNQQFGQQGFGQPGMAQGNNQAVVVGAQYCRPHEQVFFLAEKLLSASGDDFSIKDANNPAHFYELKSSTFSMKGARVLKDSGGNVILNMKHKMLSGKLWYVNRGSNDKDAICEVRAGSGGGQRQTVEIFLKGNTSHHFSTARPDYFAQGDVRGKTFTILRGQMPIAEISRKLPQESSKQRITGKDAYALRVNPGADAAFCIAIVLIVDELFND
ncbi:hypothetical protein WJX73_003221 [Symbiochloris irregularis]|uniref:Uncharacterized protein n=1 Tax=Symbiochloris irregularis TaxID=706552 RepID=A0AAW1NSJ5_9CHLO